MLESLLSLKGRRRITDVLGSTGIITIGSYVGITSDSSAGIITVSKNVAVSTNSFSAGIITLSKNVAVHDPTLVTDA